ncbi:MAG: Cys-Gln thioester bond-forming surface protein [Clostridia bacterium]|nr:Cys-Gln thioester bond-forming surface protein [Clostridia bacterium]
MKIKEKNKIIAMLLIVVTVLMTFNMSFAANLSSANLYSKGDCGSLLKYKGTTVKTTMVVYAKDGVEYPAYCMDKSLPGVGENGSYTVSINGVVSNALVWRAIINGYPYKTPAELGCSNVNEAFTATKQAVYCMLYGNNVNDYTAIGDAGIRTLNALKTIVAKANASTESKPSTNIQISENSSSWNIDTINKKYVSKTYNVVSVALNGNYEVSLNGNIPENTKITDLNNNQKTVFAKDEKFKIVIPIQNMSNEGEFTINIAAKANTKPVFYGTAPNSSLQDYAITSETYEDATGSIKQSYFKNITKIVVLKQDGVNKDPLSKGEFSLLDENKNIVYSNLVTDERGEVVIKNLTPGKFYLKEEKAPNDYVLYDKLIPVELELNEVVNVTVNNFKKDIVEIIDIEENIVVSQKQSEINLEKSESNTIIQNQGNSIKLENTNSNEIINNTNNNIEIENSNINKLVDNSNNNISLENNNTNVQIDNSNSNINIENTNTNVLVKLPKTGM